jgi:hypothetical protein
LLLAEQLRRFWIDAIPDDLVSVLIHVPHKGEWGLFHQKLGYGGDTINLRKPQWYRINSDGRR